MSRRIAGLLWAEPTKRPLYLPRSRARGSKAAGLGFEKALAKALPEAKHGQWFEFMDANGRGFCQPDLIILRPGQVFVLECKLSNVAEAMDQLRGLYIPVLEYVYKRPVRGVVVTRHLTRWDGGAFDSLDKALAHSNGVPAVLHWLGRGPL